MPPARRITDMATLADAAILANDFAQALELARYLVVEFDNLIEGVGNFGVDALIGIGDPNRKISVSKRFQSVQELSSGVSCSPDTFRSTATVPSSRRMGNVLNNPPPLFLSPRYARVTDRNVTKREPC